MAREDSSSSDDSIVSHNAAEDVPLPTSEQIPETDGQNQPVLSTDITASEPSQDNATEAQEKNNTSHEADTESPKESEETVIDVNTLWKGICARCGALQLPLYVTLNPIFLVK